MTEWQDGKISEWVDGMKITHTLQKAHTILFQNNLNTDFAVDDYLVDKGVIYDKAYNEDKCRWVVPNPSDEQVVALIDALVECDEKKVAWLMARLQDA